MFGVLIESKATAQRRSGGALLSVVAHTVVLSLAVVLTAQGSPGPIPPRKDPPIVTFIPLGKARPAPPRREGGRTNGPCPCLPTLPRRNLTFDPAIPSTPIELSDHGTDVPNTSSFWTDHPGRLGAAPLDSARSGEPWTVRETSARVVRAARPRYPEMLRAAGVEGKVLVRFIIDTAGRVESMTVLQSTHELFSRAVRDVMPSLRLLPAEVNGRRVPMLAEMAFEFALDRR
jgi:protein TonB